MSSNPIVQANGQIVSAISPFGDRFQSRYSVRDHDPMDFDQLEIFLEVARLSSFSRAAEKRFRTQPAISSQIRALEEEVGARLLDRSGGRVS